MSFYLQTAVLAPTKALRITKKEFQEISLARELLVAAFPIEENFDLLIGNYLELENSAISIASNNMIRSFRGYQDGFEARSTLNRRVVNLLTTARQFVDQLPKWIKACGLDPSFIREEQSLKYDADFEYRFMESLRNHVQHSGSAVHGVSMGGQWLPKGKRELQNHTTIPYSSRKLLEQDKNFKKKVLAECPEKIDLLHASRVYIESLGAIQHSARKALEPAISTASSTTTNTIKRYRKFSKSTAVGLTAYEKAGDNILQKIPVFIEWEEIRLELSKRNGTLTNLRRRFVSSKSLEDHL